ncbi:hypothetical protein AgCh_034297 [Apium graveolens]
MGFSIKMLAEIGGLFQWGQAEREFKVEVEAIGKVRHKNLVGLIGYCVEGSQRLLVYEYVDNGNLEQWLHGDVGPISPLSWEIRMKIAIGAAKGLAYLHEGLEPKVVHRDVKSNNILMDRKWNPKVLDFGFAKLLGFEISHVTTRVIGTFSSSRNEIDDFVVRVTEQVIEVPVTEQMDLGPRNRINGFMVPVMERKMPRRFFCGSQGRVPVPSVSGSSEVVMLDQRWSIEFLY